MTSLQRITQLIDQLDSLFSGSPWFGPSWQETLERIPVEAAGFGLPGSPSIAGSLAHVIAWRTFVIRKLQGQEDHDLKPGEDWPDFASEDWQKLVRRFLSSQDELLDALTEFPASMLDDNVPGRGYSWGFMIQGLVDHDVYHMAQINLLRKQFESR